MSPIIAYCRVSTGRQGKLGLGLEAQRQAIACGPLRRALCVAAPGAVAGARVLVLDDVLTDGSTLREVGRVLRRAGAREVAGLILARPAWRERPPDSHSEQ